MIDKENTMVKLKNNTGDPMHLRENLRDYHIQPGGSLFVPYSVIIAHFGDPEAMNISKDEDYRRRELERMKVRWGLYHRGNVHTDFPAIEIEDVEGNKIWSVVQDPEGKNATPSIEPVDAANAAEATAMLQRKINQMQAQIDLMSNATTESGDEVILDASPEERPERPDSKKGLTAKVDGPVGSQI